MGAAGAKWDEAKHFRGYHGRFAAGRDRSEGRAAGGSNVFRPPTPAAVQRARKERLPAAVRETRAIYDKRARGEKLSWKEQSTISWASPRQIAAQRAKTGDAFVPRAEAVSKQRSSAAALGISRPGAPGAPRTGIKKTFAGKAVVERGNYRELRVPTPGRPGSMDLRTETRVRRSFDWPTGGKKKTARSLMSSKPKAAPAPAAPKPVYNAATSDARLREIATSLGIELPKRAGRNQIIKLIEGH